MHDDASVKGLVRMEQNTNKVGRGTRGATFLIGSPPITAPCWLSGGPLAVTGMTFKTYFKTEKNVRSVIGYTRVSTKRQAQEGASLTAQKLHIRQFAKESHLKVKKIYQGVDTAQNEENGTNRPGFKKAVEHSLRTGWPIIAASADRFSWTGATYERFVAEGGRAYGAREGFGVDKSVMRAAIKRAEFEGKRISRNTKEGQRKARERGAVFGNPRLAEARLKSAAARSENARNSRLEFRTKFFQARLVGARTDAAVAEFLNDKGVLSARGTAWTPENVARMRRELDAFAAVDPSASPVSHDTAIVGTDGWITPSGFDRLRSIMTQRRTEEPKAIRILTEISARALTSSDAERLTNRVAALEVEIRQAKAERESLWGSF